MSASNRWFSLHCSMERLTRVVSAMARVMLLIGVVVGIVHNLFLDYKYHIGFEFTTAIAGRTFGMGMALSFVTAVLYLIRWRRGDKGGRKDRLILWFQVMLMLMAAMSLMAWDGVS
jgi:hypothetical protein